MRAKSHHQFGRYLANIYFPHIPHRWSLAFIAGCSQPDKNITTYLKGSIRSHWLKGHNWSNAQRYMQRLARRLERREKFRLLDYYAMGKLVHYTMDAFTAPHNSGFSSGLQAHRDYEKQLQQYFLPILDSCPTRLGQSFDSVMDTICAYHREYMRHPGSIQTDIQYCLAVTQLVVSMLTAPLYPGFCPKIFGNCSCNIPCTVV